MLLLSSSSSISCISGSGDNRLILPLGGMITPTGIVGRLSAKGVGVLGKDPEDEDEDEESERFECRDADGDGGNDPKELDRKGDGDDGKDRVE